MLDSMRKLSNGFVSKLLMGLLVVSFGLWGVGDILRDRGPSYAAKVGSDVISVNDFQRQGALMSRQLESMGVKNLGGNTLQLAAIRQLVQQKLNLLATQDMGLFVGDAQIAKIIAGLPQLQDKDGKFDRARFTDMLKREQISEAIFITQLKQDVVAEFLAESLSMNDAAAPANVVALETMTSGETRDAVLLTIPARAPTEAAGDAALKEYYDLHKEVLYKLPEHRTLEYVTLSEADVNSIGGKDVSRDEAMRTLSNNIEDELAAGKKLGEALAKLGIKSAPHTLENVTADMAKTGGDDTSRTVIGQGFGMGAGEISGLISTKSGTRLIVSVKAITEAAPKPYDSVKADVAQRLAKQLAREEARKKAQEVKAALAKTPNWQSVASEFKLDSRVASAIARPVEGKPATTSSVPTALQQAIFEHAVGEVAGPLVQENGDQLIAYITQSHLPDVKPDAVASKTTTGTTAKLAKDIENRAYLSFAKRHPVKINPAVMRSQQPQAEQ